MVLGFPWFEMLMPTGNLDITFDAAAGRRYRQPILCQWGTGDVSAQALEFVALAGTDSNRRMQ
jgi:hypothetical protein